MSFESVLDGFGLDHQHQAELPRDDLQQSHGEVAEETSGEGRSQDSGRSPSWTSQGSYHFVLGDGKTFQYFSCQCYSMFIYQSIDDLSPVLLFLFVV